MTPCFSPDTELIRGRELTLFKLTTPSVPSTGHTVVSPPSLATSFCHLSSQPYTHPMPSLPPGFPICVPAPCSFPCGRASVPAPLSPFLIRSLSYGHVPVGPPAPEHGFETLQSRLGACVQLSHSSSGASNSFLCGVLPDIPEAVCCVPGML